MTQDPGTPAPRTPDPQNPYPHDPFGGQPAVAPDAAATDGTPQGGPASSDAPAWTASAGASADPAPAAAPGAGAPTGAPAPGDPYATGSGDPSAQPATGSPYAAPAAGSPYAAPAAGYQQAPGAGQQHGPQPGSHQAPPPGAAPGAGAHPAAAPLPPGFKGLYEGPLSGQGTTPSDSRLWSMFAQLSAVIGYVLGAGFLGWVGPLIIFLMYKDRDRYVRYNAAESLNAAIAVVIVNVVLGILITILTVVTFGLASPLYALIGIPALVHVIFAIVGAVKVNQGQWWNYPVNIRLVR